jgi:hypothetical protein
MSWAPERKKCLGKEKITFSLWGIEFGKLTKKTNTHTSQDKSLNTWSRPPSNFIKLNFDGASKENKGPSWLRRYFKYSFGHILRVFTWYLGVETNNVASIVSLEKGLIVASVHVYDKLIVKSDSIILVNALK